MKNVKVILIGVALCATVFANQRIGALGGDPGFWPGDKDNINKVINISSSGQKLFNEILPQIIQQENNIFEKLYNEKLNFCNSLKLILGKKIRIKAEKIK